MIMSPVRCTDVENVFEIREKPSVKQVQDHRQVDPIFFALTMPVVEMEAAVRAEGKSRVHLRVWLHAHDPPTKFKGSTGTARMRRTCKFVSAAGSVFPVTLWGAAALEPLENGAQYELAAVEVDPTNKRVSMNDDGGLRYVKSSMTPPRRKSPLVWSAPA